MYVHTKTYTQMFRAVSFVIAKQEKQPKCLSTNEQINKMQYIHTILFAIRRNEVLIHATKWMKPGNTMLSKRSQSPKAIYYMIVFILNFQNMQHHRLEIAQDWGEMVVTTNGYKPLKYMVSELQLNKIIKNNQIDGIRFSM